jgi:uncharacterized RDD family membrane protein YckC
MEEMGRMGQRLEEVAEELSDGALDRRLRRAARVLRLLAVVSLLAWLVLLAVGVDGYYDMFDLGSSLPSGSPLASTQMSGASLARLVAQAAWSASPYLVAGVVALVGASVVERRRLEAILGQLGRVSILAARSARRAGDLIASVAVVVGRSSGRPGRVGSPPPSPAAGDA